MLSTLEAARHASRVPGARLRATGDLDGWQVSAYEWPSAPDGVPVVFVNGMEERWDFCAGVAARLGRTSYRVFSVELPWAGTQGNRWGVTASGGAWLRAALELLAIDTPVVIAHSFGANALLSFMDRFGAEGLRAAVLVSPFYKQRAHEFDWALLRFYVDEFQRLMLQGLEARPGAARLSPEVASSMAARVCDRIGPYGWLQFFDLFSRTPDLSLARMTVPCLVVGGETDFASRPDDCLALASALPAGTGRVLPGCGHFSMTQHPDVVAGVIEAFLAQHLNHLTEESIR